jgi:hypothetical protein
MNILMRVRFIPFLFVLAGMFLIISCGKNNYKVNVSSVNVNVEIKRLELDLFTLDPSQIAGKVPFLKEKYGPFLQIFSYIINTGDVNDSSFGDFLVRFCTDKLNYEVYESVKQHYPDIKDIESDLRSAFRHYRWYFPERKIPALYTCISGFNSSIITADSVLGISLDRYLGSDCQYYPRLGIYSYISARMNSWNIVPDCIYGWGSTEWDFPGLKYQTDNALTEMIHEGKLKYFEKCMLPEVNDTLIFGFTANQMKFCKNNEGQMWQYLIEHNLLFNTDQFVIRKLTGEAPFTSFFSNESPGKAAVWTGFRIVESYMMKNKDITLGELMNTTDIQGILEKAKYSPQ